MMKKNKIAKHALVVIFIASILWTGLVSFRIGVQRTINLQDDTQLLIENGTPPSCEHITAGSLPDTSRKSYFKTVDSKTDGAGNTRHTVLKLYDNSEYSWNIGRLYFLENGSTAARNCTIELSTCIKTDGTIFYHNYFGIAGSLGWIVLFELESGGSLNDPQIRYHHGGGEVYTGLHQTWDRWYNYSIQISCDGGYSGLAANQFRFQIYNETGDMIFNSSALDMVVAQPTGGAWYFQVQSSETQKSCSQWLDSCNVEGVGNNLEDSCAGGIPSFQMNFVFIMLVLVVLMSIFKKSNDLSNITYPRGHK